MGRRIYPTDSLSNGSLDTKSVLTASNNVTYLNLNTAASFKVIIAANTSIYFPHAPSGENIFSFTVITVNDSTPNRTVGFAGTGAAGSVKWAGGLTPPRTTAAGAVDVYTFYTEDGGQTFVGSLAIADVK